jgi:hypothetical protein
VQVINSTISGNVSTNGSNGDISVGSGGVATLTNVTVAGNTRGITVFSGGSLTIRNSIVANSGSANCTGTIQSGDFNLDSGTTCGFNKPHDLSNMNPLLDALQVNAPGTTATQALLPGSPAIDAGGSSANGCPVTDQRGVSRPRGLACDIGAFEVIPVIYPAPSARDAGMPPDPSTNPQPPVRNQPVVPPSSPVLPMPPSRP